MPESFINLNHHGWPMQLTSPEQWAVLNTRRLASLEWIKRNPAAASSRKALTLHLQVRRSNLLAARRTIACAGRPS